MRALYDNAYRLFGVHPYCDSEPSHSFPGSLPDTLNLSMSKQSRASCDSQSVPTEFAAIGMITVTLNRKREI